MITKGTFGLKKTQTPIGKKAIDKIKRGVKVAGGIAAVGALVGGALLVDKKVGEVKQEVQDKKAKAEAGIDVARGVADIAASAGRSAAANPLQAKKEIEKGKRMVEGVAKAAKIDVEGAAEQAKFAKKVKAGQAGSGKFKNPVGDISGQGFGGGLTAKEQKKADKKARKAEKAAAKASRKEDKKARKEAKKAQKAAKKLKIEG